MVDNHIPMKFCRGLVALRDVLIGKKVILPAGQKVSGELLENATKELLNTIIVVRHEPGLSSIIKENISHYENTVTKRVTKLGEIIPAGTTLFTEGENTHKVFLLLSGEVEISIANKHISTITKEGVFIGEMAAIRSKSRSATAVTKTECRVHSFDGSSLVNQAKEQPLIMVRLCRSLAIKLHEINQKISEEVTSTVSERDISQAFESEPSAENEGMTQTYPAGKALFHQGETSLDLYILLDGKLSIEVDGRNVATLSERGSIIGEMSSLLSQPRTATVRTECESTLASICITKLEQFTSFMPGLLEKIAISLAERIATTNIDYIRLTR